MCPVPDLAFHWVHVLVPQPTSLCTVWSVLDGTRRSFPIAVSEHDGLYIGKYLFMYLNVSITQINIY